MNEAKQDAQARRRSRIGFLNSHPIQYAAPLYAYLNSSQDIEPVALYLTDFSLRGAVDKQFGRAVKWDIDLLQGYESHFIGETYRTDRPDSFFALKGHGIGKALGRLELDALVVHGHNYLASLRAMASAKILGIPVMYKGETHLLLPRSKAKKALRGPIMRALYSQIDCFLAISQRNREYYEAFGIGDDRIAPFPYTVDNERFISASSVSGEERRKIRQELGLSESLPVVVYASKFMRRKHPDDVVTAAGKLHDAGIQCQVLLIGTGEMEDELREQARAASPLPVVFAGFRNQSELPAILGACDVFVLPSENEPFGLIVNEAMCAGLPVVVSEEVGCVPDLVLNAITGRTFEAGNADSLAAALRPLIEQEDLRARMGAASRQRISEWGFEQNLRGLREALRKIAR